MATAGCSKVTSHATAPGVDIAIAWLAVYAGEACRTVIGSAIADAGMVGRCRCIFCRLTAILTCPSKEAQAFPRTPLAPAHDLVCVRSRVSSARLLICATTCYSPDFLIHVPAVPAARRLHVAHCITFPRVQVALTRQAVGTREPRIADALPC